MEYSLPHRIAGEKDLKAYEDYLKSDNCQLSCVTKEVPAKRPTQMLVKAECENRSLPLANGRAYLPDTLTNPAFFQGYLKSHMGKLIKIESLIGNCLECRVGTLLDIGADYIVIKLYRSCCSMMIQANDIKYITIVHDNDMTKTGLY